MFFSTKHINLSVKKLYEQCLNNCNKCIKATTDALIVYSGKYTGRIPKKKRVVFSENTKKIWWKNSPNIPITKEIYTNIKNFTMNKLNDKSLKNDIYMIDSYASSDPINSIKLRTYCINPYHALFVNNMFKPANIIFDEPDFHIYNIGKYPYQSINNDVNDYSEKEVIALNLDEKELLIVGSEYAGEMKKGVFTYFMYEMQNKNNLCLHSSVNISKNRSNKDLTFFFGLSGTGKTSLSIDSKRILLGDDEHVWTENGVFNIENGCYAKCINLSKNNEPEIYDAIKYNTILRCLFYKFN